MPEDLASTLRDVDPAVLGARIKAARVRVGLTQSVLAADDVSVGFVSRIEGGHRRPDADLLVKLADRLGVTTDELLLGVATDHLAELRLTLDHAELALVTGSAADALTKVVAVLDDPACTDLPELHRRARRLRAGALEATGDLQAAILLLEDLTSNAVPDLDWIADSTALCRCYRESGEFGRAIDTATAASKRIEDLGMEGLDEAIRLTLTLAAAYIEQGDLNHASRICQRAVERAEAVDSALARAMAYWNSSAVENMQGRVGVAIPMARRALEVLEAADDARNTARLRTQLGLMHLNADPPRPDVALAFFGRAAEELAVTGAAPVDTLDNDLGHARARLMVGDVSAARRGAESIAAAAGPDMPILAADAYSLLGEIAMAHSDLDEARAHFTRAVQRLSGVGADRAAAQRWFDLATMFEAVGDSPAAIDAYRRAGAATGLLPPSSSSAVRSATVRA